MKRFSQILMITSLAIVASGCEKSAEDLEKEQQEKIIREELVKQIEDGKEFQEASKRPSNLNGAYFDPSQPGGVGKLPEKEPESK